MTPKKIEELNKEWLEFVTPMDFKSNPFVRSLVFRSIADYWLSKLQEAREEALREVEEEQKEVEALCEKVCGPNQKFKSSGCGHLPVLQALERVRLAIKEGKL